ncbi:Periplasmic binding protein [uncultured delta proteobacterium]|uniref:Periplasmic binding protein n=1 Tax=uncultured delta proteobacterium TaxID=34034 RepID=A0A212JTC4_9DELT|nr:Periplasmic binding protein [uncultured delta proteobacterium]
MFRSLFAGLLLLPLFVCATPSPVPAATRTVTDMRGKAVSVPVAPKRVVTISDGFVEAVMTHLGVVDTIVGIGSWGLKRDYKYQFATASGATYEHRGWNTMKFLHPWLDALPCVNSPQGNVLNFETLAKAEPDLVIVRVGDCTVRADAMEATEKTLATLEELGIPLVATFSPTCFGGTDMSTMKTEMQLLGEVFGQKEKAGKLADSLAAFETLIRERTADIPEDKKTRLLYFGLNPATRKEGGSGTVWGLDSPESYIVESVANAKNAYTGNGKGVPMSAEQIYALDPDVIVLPTSNGYHPPRELMEAPYYANLSELGAVKAKRVYAMPWTPMNCSRRLEYPLDMLIIAKAAYPDRFADINVHDAALRLYKELYGVDDATARGLAATQLLDWMLEGGF